jgi:carbon-monoxide dehydrogenase large subunit
LQLKVVFTNTVPVDAYRGALRPEATFVLERLMDIARAKWAFFAAVT